MSRGDEKYERRKAATSKAAEKDQADQEELRRKMESGKRKPPARLTRKELDLAARMDDGSGGPVKKKRFGRG